MATEAEIIPEPVAVVKREEESKHLILELCEKAAEIQPTEGDECLAKAEKMEVAASNNGVETTKTVSGSNPEISKGESFSMSPEISKVANETCVMPEHKEVDDTPLKAETMLEDEEKMAIDRKFQVQEEADIESDKQEANLELKKHESIDSPDPTIGCLKKDNETVTEACNSILVQEEGTEASESIETSGTQKDQMISDGTGDTLASTAAETSENKDHQTSSELLDSKKCSERNEASENKQEGIKKELEDCTAEKPELKDAMENMEDSTSANNKEDSMEKEIEKRKPEKEVCKGSETAASGTEKENPDMEEHPIAGISNLTISDETVKESIEGNESSPMKSTEEVSGSNIDEKAESDNGPSAFDVVRAAETEETNIEEAEEEKKETKDILAVEHDADIDLKQEESFLTSEKDKEIPQEEDGMQDKVPHGESEDQMETTTRVIPLKEVVGDEVKEHSAMPSKEMTDEASEKHQVPHENSETPLSQATDEISMQNEDEPSLDIPKADEVKEHLAEEPNVHTEQEPGKCSSVSEVTGLSNGEEPREIERPDDACEAKTLQGEQSSDSGLETVKIEDGEPLDEATDLGEAASTCKDGEKTIEEDGNLAKNLAKPESLKEDNETGKEEKELPREAHDQILEKTEHESVEDSSDTKATAEVCLQMEEQRVPKAISEEETIVYHDPQKEEPEEQIQTTSSALPSEESEHGAEAITAEIEHGKTKEEVTEKLDVVTADEITGEHTLSVNKPEEGTASSSLLSKELEGENISKVEETEEEKIKEAEIPDKISDDSSDTKKTAEIQELEGAKKDETAAARALQVEEPDKQSFSPSASPEAEEEKGKEAEVLGKERPQEPEAVVDQEINVAQASEKSLETETISNVEKLQVEKRKEAENLENEKCEDSSAELHALPKEEEISSGQTLSEEKSDEHLHISTSAIASEELEQENKKAEDEKTNKEETIKAEIQEDASDVKTTEERSIQLEAVAEDEKTAGDTLNEKKSEEQIPNPVVTLPSDEHKPETIKEVDKTVPEEVCSEKDDPRGPQAVFEGETVSSQVVAEESEHGTLREEKKITEAETLEEEISPHSECPRELQGAIEDGAAAAQALPGEKPVDQCHITTSTLPSDVQEDETKETELQEDDTQGKNSEQTMENEGNEIILNEVSKEEAMADKEVTETSYSIPHSEELSKGGYGEDELKDKLIEDKTNEAIEITCQTEEHLVVEAQKTRENEIIEKQIISEDKTVEDPGQASVASVETETVKEEESSTALSQAEGTKNIAEEATNIASDKQNPREFDPIESTEISSLIGKENVLIDSQDRIAETSQKAEVEHAAEETTDNSGDHVESSTKETLEVNRDMIEVREAKDEPEEKSPAPPPCKLPSEEEHGVTTKVDAAEEKEQKQVEENKELKAVVEQEIVAVQVPATELSEETLKDDANNNIEKEIVAEDKTVEDLEQASVQLSVPTEQQDRASESSKETEVGVDRGEEKKMDNSSVEITQEPASADSGKLSLSDLLERSTGEEMQVVERVIEEEELTVSKEEPHLEESETIHVKEAKTDEEKEEGEEHNKTDSGSDAPVMVEAPRDTESKPHKKSHNILSGVGSKVKHSISKVKKAITGKSSHSKESKPISPKGTEK